MKPTVFVPEPIAACGMALLEAACDCVAPWADGTAPGDAEAREMLHGADAVIVRLFEIGAADLEQSPRLKVIAKHGVGVDNIDCDAATARGIPVVFTPKANANSVAEHTIGLMLALARNVVPASIALRDGRFADRSQFIGVELAGRTLGIVGLGRIGSRVAEIAAVGLGMKVCGYDPYVAPGAYSGPAERVESLDELLAVADFLTLHVGLTAETRHLLDDRRLARLKPGCRVLNTSRGAVIDERALVRALEEEPDRRRGARRVRGGADRRRSPPVPGTQRAADAAHRVVQPRVDGPHGHRLRSGRPGRAAGPCPGRPRQSRCHVTVMSEYDSAPGTSYGVTAVPATPSSQQWLTIVALTSGQAPSAGTGSMPSFPSWRRWAERLIGWTGPRPVDCIWIGTAMSQVQACRMRFFPSISALGWTRCPRTNLWCVSKPSPDPCRAATWTLAV